ncbi:hypothetical protein M1O13_04620 [Dehalococcoidia bacterium]|nr:hypothetical protein [Dehalococcoidia bacterium]
MVGAIIKKFAEKSPYESRDEDWTPINAVDAILGRKPVKDLVSHQCSTLERLNRLPDLVVLNTVK